MFTRNNPKKEKEEYKFDAEYMGGHKLYPKKKDTEVLIYEDRIVLKKLDVTIPFDSISNIENESAERLTKTRMFLTPFCIGFFWKKDFHYTVIDYNDGIDNQSIVIDFHRKMVKAQQAIYQKITAARQSKRLTSPERYV
jgi:hypothetical protein